MLASIGPGKAYVKGYEIVNKETKHLTLNKARETLNRSDIRLKSSGLPTYSVNNTFGTVPLNAEGSDLTAYPNIFLCSNFNDGSIGLNNTEIATAIKQTTDRRGKYFDIDTGIKTIYVKTAVNIDNIGGSATTDNDARLAALSNLWYIVNRSGTTYTVSSVSAIGFSIVNRIEVDSSTSQTFLEITVSGKKSELDEKFVEYDNEDASKNRKLFLTENEAKNTSATEFGTIVDYNETITPVIGLAKPSNVTLIEKGDGFNSDIDVVASKGRQSNGNAVYNTTFGLSYFDPQFFTKILLDGPLPTSTTSNPKFDNGMYVYGLQSGAYGVIEGAADQSYSKYKTLMVKTLFGTFQSGEPIRDEKNNTIRIRKDNTISHFVVANRGSNYNAGVKLRIDGVDYDISKINLNLSGNKIISAEIVNRDLVNVEYSRPPVVNVVDASGSSGTGAVVTPVLVRDSVVTYTPQNVKSFFCEFGSGNANTCLLYTSPSPRDRTRSRMPSSA